MKYQLKKWKHENGKDFFYASRDEEMYAVMSDTFPKTEKECQQIVSFFAESKEKTEYVRAICIEGKIQGCIAAFFESDLYCKNAELAYWLNKEYRGNGIMPAVIDEVCSNLFCEYDIHRIYARPFEKNQASRKALQKAGFVQEGILKENAYKQCEYLNTALYARLREKNV